MIPKEKCLKYTTLSMDIVKQKTYQDHMDEWLTLKNFKQNMKCRYPQQRQVVSFEIKSIRRVL